ncbi:MAG TPA: response regulator [Chloroflexota bacterium]|jgi:CheY-like chemotaxis protein|nr:response regulator [Chloroflexota bacterium]
MTSVLVVDDEPMLRTLVADVLDEAGYFVTTASDGEQAIERLRDMRPDVLLLDLSMPGIDGWAVLESLAASKSRRGLPIGIMSAARNVERAIPFSGAVRLISKPFDLDDLLQTVHELATHSAVSYSALHPELPRRRPRRSFASAV